MQFRKKKAFYFFKQALKAIFCYLIRKGNKQDTGWWFFLDQHFGWIWILTIAMQLKVN